MEGSEIRGCAAGGWLEAGHLLGEGLRLLFTDRNGGVSRPPYATLNLADGRGDDAAAVRANRQKVACALGIGAGRLVFAQQVHGLRVTGVKMGGWGKPRTVPRCDGLYTAEPGLALAVLTADCVPLALAFPTAAVVAMLHAGWRGTLGDIAGGALRLLREGLGLAPEEARVVIGPAIGPCCYRVEEGRARLFVERYGEESGVVRENDGLRVDLSLANRVNLLQAGVRGENIHRVGGCTCCDERYFSFRREGTTGRQGAFILVQEGFGGFRGAGRRGGSAG